MSTEALSISFSLILFCLVSSERFHDESEPVNGHMIHQTSWKTGANDSDHLSLQG